jgi:hypothetical protein
MILIRSEKFPARCKSGLESVDIADSKRRPADPVNRRHDRALIENCYPSSISSGQA